MVSTMVWPSRFRRAHELPQPLAQLDVDARGRLVEHDHRRLVHQRLRHQHAALHAAGERAHVGVGLGGEVEVVHHLVDPGVVAADAEVARLDAQRLAHREERIEHQLLRHDAEHAARAPVVGDARRRPSPTPCRRRRAPGRRSTLISVVLPAPFGPSRPKNSPSAMARLTPTSACTRAVALLDAADFDRVQWAAGSRSSTPYRRDEGLQRLGQVGEGELAASRRAPRAARRAAARARRVELGDLRRGRRCARPRRGGGGPPRAAARRWRASPAR